MSDSTADTPLPLRGLETDAALRAILQGTAMETGEGFFAALVQNLAQVLNTHGAWVTEYFPEKRTLRALAFWMDGHWVKDYEVDIAGSPCEQVIDTRGLVHFPDRLIELFPDEPDVKAIGAVSYMGVPLLDMDGRILGHMAVIDRRPMPDEPRLHAIFQIFAARAAAELQRLRAEAAVREREEKVGRLLNSAIGRHHRIGRPIPGHARQSGDGKGVPLLHRPDDGPGFPPVREPGRRPAARSADGGTEPALGGTAILVGRGGTHRPLPRRGGLPGRSHALALRHAPRQILHADPAQCERPVEAEQKIQSLTAEAAHAAR